MSDLDAAIQRSALVNMDGLDIGPSVSPVIASLTRAWRDALSPGEQEAIFAPILPHLDGTAVSADGEAARRLIHADWTLRVYAANWLYLVGLRDMAELLASGPAFQSVRQFVDFIPVLERAARDAHSAWMDERGFVKARTPPDEWRALLEDVRNGVRIAVAKMAEASVRTLIEDPKWPRVEFLIWSSVEACVWALAWRGVRQVIAPSAHQCVQEAIVPLATSLAKLAAEMLAKMASSYEVVDNILYGRSEEVAQWVLHRIPEMRGRSFGPCAAIGVLRDGNLVGGFVFSGYAQHADGSDITINGAAAPGNRVTRRMWERVYSYPFVQIGCARVSDYIIETNQNAIRFAERSGFKLEGRKRRGYGSEDVLLYGMLRHECRYLKEH